MKMSKGARPTAARKRKLEKMVAEAENIDRSPPCAKPHGKQKQVKTKAGKGPGLMPENASNEPVTPVKNKHGTGERPTAYCLLSAHHL